MRNLEEWKSLSTAITELIVNDCCCNDRKLKSVNLSAYKRLKRIEIGKRCFIFAKELIVDGLNELESVVIGSDSFSETGLSEMYYHVVFKDCPRLREVKIDCLSFIYDYTQEDYGLEVSEVIAVDSVKTVSDRFSHAREKSSVDYSESRIDESLLIETLHDCTEPSQCSRVVFESD